MKKETKSDHGLVIVGAGTAGVELAFAARRAGYAGQITLVDRQGIAPYHRPPLSKHHLLAEEDLDPMPLRPRDSYAQSGIALHLGVGACEIDRAQRRLRLSDGRTLPYGHLALSTGGRARRLHTLSGSNVLLLREGEDASRMRAAMRSARCVAIVGGGYVGLECASAARTLGLEVHLIERGTRLLARTASTGVSNFLQCLHRQEGVHLHLESTPVALERDALDRVTALGIGTERLQVDLVIVAVGMEADIDLALTAGLAVESGGIVVDGELRSSDDRIFALGDCALFWSERYERRLRFESVPNAMEQARFIAGILTGKAAIFNPVPWFWTEQYGVRLQSVGLPEANHTSIVRGDVSKRSFSLVQVSGSVIQAADSVGRPSEFLMLRRLAESGSDVDATLLQAATNLNQLTA